MDDTYTKVQNEVIEQLAKIPLTGLEFQLVFVVWRKTWGWHKDADAISLSQFAEATGASRRAVIYGLQNLESKKIIIVQKRNHQSNVVFFNRNYAEWVVQNFAPQVENNRHKAKLRSAKLCTSAKLRKKLVQNFAPTKDNTKERKKINKEKELLEKVIEIVNPRERVTDSRVSMVKARLKDYSQEDIEAAARVFAQSDWHRQNGQLSVDNLLSPTKFGRWFAKIGHTDPAPLPPIVIDPM